MGSSYQTNKLNEAFRLMVSDPNVPLIAVHEAKYFADKDEKLSMGPGGFVKGKQSSFVSIACKLMVSFKKST